MKVKNNSNEDNRIVRLWEPFKFEANEDYDFFPTSLYYKIINKSLRNLVYTLLPPIHKIFLGLKVYGKENLYKINSGAVSICNHVHIIDCTIVACNLNKKRICFPTLESNYRIPLVRHLIKYLGAVPIPKNRKAFIKLVKSLITQLDNGCIVHLYPEAVLYPYHKELREFKRGAFLLAYECDKPILPCVIKFVKNPNRRIKIKRKPSLEFHILEPIYPNKSNNAKQESERLMKLAYERMNEVIHTHSHM